MELIDKVNEIKIEDFLAALDIKPIKREGNILTYNAPYDFDMEWGGPETFGKPTCLVDTERNLWRDKYYSPWQPLFSLAHDMTGYYNELKIVGFILAEMAAYRKRCEVQVNKPGQNDAEKEEHNISASDKKSSEKQKETQIMTYKKQDIPRIPLTEFMEALGEKPVKAFEGMKLYYAPHRDDPEPMLVVDTNINRWYDHATDLSGDILDLATLKMDPKLYTDPHDFIIKYMNEYEQGKKLSAMARQPLETKVVTPDIYKIRLTDFMKALGQEEPVTADGNLRIYKAPYDPNGEPTMVINTETNLWRDTKSGAYGGIYDLAYELTGSCNMSELNHYIAGQMSCMEKSPKDEPPKQEKEPDKPKRKMRL